MTLLHKVIVLRAPGSGQTMLVVQLSHYLHIYTVYCTHRHIIFPLNLHRISFLVHYLVHIIHKFNILSSRCGKKSPSTTVAEECSHHIHTLCYSVME